MTQFDLFNVDENSEFSDSVLEQAKRPVETPQIQFFSFVRTGVFGQIQDGERLRQIWLTQLQNDDSFQGRCSCSAYSRDGKCTHTENLKEYSRQQYKSDIEGPPGIQFERSHWYTSAQNWFHKAGKLTPKVKLPHILCLVDGAEETKIKITGKNLAPKLSELFYGFLLQLDEESLRKIRCQILPDVLSWETFYSQTLDIGELAMHSQKIQDDKMEYESSILFSFMKHAFFYFDIEGTKPPKKTYSKNELSVEFFF